MTDEDAHKHRFGSSETERKLNCLRSYLSAYCLALKRKNFALVYIDAFAGSGSRTETKTVLPFFEDGEIYSQEITTPGSARIALETNPGFHTNVFVEKDPQKIAALKLIKAEFPSAGVHILEGDANGIVQRICARYRWKQEAMRGVIFLDPYGMEVSWETVEAIAKTEALDCWYFFPLSGLYRNAAHDPVQIDRSKEMALNRVFGTGNWRDEWYTNDIDLQDRNLFGEPTAIERRSVDVDAIEAWVHERLKTVFKGTVLKPLRLYHPNGAPMASLFFAVSNTDPKAVGLASKIAGHILRAGISSQRRSR